MYELDDPVWGCSYRERVLALSCVLNYNGLSTIYFLCLQRFFSAVRVKNIHSYSAFLALDASRTALKKRWMIFKSGPSTSPSNGSQMVGCLKVPQQPIAGTWTQFIIQ